MPPRPASASATHPAPSGTHGLFDPPRACCLCPRLVRFREANRAANPDWFNAPVPSFGKREARLLIVGLAPGLRGANRTGRPFTGDHAGELLYETLIAFGFASGRYGADAGDGLRLKDCMISNAVRCVPPENKPTQAEAAACRPFLANLIATMPRLRVVLALGRIAHESIVKAAGLRPTSCVFAHGARHALATGITLIDCYHCSRYNTSTGRLTGAMFGEVIRDIRDMLDAA